MARGRAGEDPLIQGSHHINSGARSVGFLFTKDSSIEKMLLACQSTAFRENIGGPGSFLRAD